MADEHKTKVVATTKAAHDELLAELRTPLVEEAARRLEGAQEAAQSEQVQLVTALATIHSDDDLKAALGDAVQDLTDRVSAVREAAANLPDDAEKHGVDVGLLAPLPKTEKGFKATCGCGWESNWPLPKSDADEAVKYHLEGVARAEADRKAAEAAGVISG